MKKRHRAEEHPVARTAFWAGVILWGDFPLVAVTIHPVPGLAVVFGLQHLDTQEGAGPSRTRRLRNDRVQYAVHRDHPVSKPAAAIVPDKVRGSSPGEFGIVGNILSQETVWTANNAIQTIVVELSVEPVAVAHRGDLRVIRHPRGAPVISVAAGSEERVLLKADAGRNSPGSVPSPCGRAT